MSSALREYVQTVEERRDQLWAALQDSVAGTSPRLRALELKRDWCPDEYLQALHSRALLELKSSGLQAAIGKLDAIASAYENMLAFAGSDRFGAGDDIAPEFLAVFRAIDKVRPVIPAAAAFEDAAPGANKSPLPEAPSSRREPSKEAMAVYWYQLATGKTQTDLASDPALMEQLGKKIEQGTISRYLKQAREWLKASNVLPAVEGATHAKVKPMDPATIEMGRREDPRTPRQRGRADDE